MSGVDHQSHCQGLKGIKSSQKHIYRYEFYRACKDSQAHDHGIPETESRNIHVNAVSHAQKPESCKDRYGMGKGTKKGFFQCFYILAHVCLLSAVVCIKLSTRPVSVQELFAIYKSFSDSSLYNISRRQMDMQTRRFSSLLAGINGNACLSLCFAVY